MRRPSRLVLAIFLLLGEARARAEDPPVEVSLQVQANVESGRGGTTFVLQGLTDLPDHTRVTSVIWYAKTPIYRSWRRSDIVGGRFQITVGPIAERVLSGTYEILVQFVKADQPAQLRLLLKSARERVERRTSVYFGTPTQEEEEEGVYRDFVPQEVRKLESFYNELTAKYDHFMGNDGRFSKEEFFNWAQDGAQRLDELRRALHDHDETRLFASRYPEMIRDVSVVLSILDLLFYQYGQEVCRKRDISEGLPDVLHAEPVFHIVPGEYRLEIERRFRDLARRDRAPEEVTCFDLYQDLLQMSELRLQLARSYQSHKERLDSSEWERWHGSWLLRLRRSRDASARYAGRAMTPGLAMDQELATLLTDLEHLGWLYFVALYEPQGAQLPEGTPRVSGDPIEMDERIKKRWAALFEVVQAARKGIHGKLRASFDLVNVEDPRIRDARGSFEKKTSAAAQWQKEAGAARDRLAAARGAIEKLHEDPLVELFFSGTAGKILTYADCLARELVEYEELDAAPQTPGVHAERLTYLRKVIFQVHDTIEKDLNRKDDLIQ